MWENFVPLECLNLTEILPISKEIVRKSCNGSFFQADDSSKKWMNKFVFLPNINMLNSFVRFLEEFGDIKKSFWN